MLALKNLQGVESGDGIGEFQLPSHGLVIDQACLMSKVLASIFEFGSIIIGHRSSIILGRERLSLTL